MHIIHIRLVNVINGVYLTVKQKLLTVISHYPVTDTFVLHKPLAVNVYLQYKNQCSIHALYSIHTLEITAAVII